MAGLRSGAAFSEQPLMRHMAHSVAHENEIVGGERPLALSRMPMPCYKLNGWTGHISREYCKPKPSTSQPLGGIVRNFELN
jgi:hypothetical protein